MNIDENIASYEASSFAVNTSNLQFDSNGMVVKEDFPAFVHEWWHYIQDITTITGQNGFYLWMRDIARMTSITCNGAGKNISVPLPRDVYDEVYSKYRRLYNIFCGRKYEERIETPQVTDEPTIDPNGIHIDGETRTFAKCRFKINDKEYDLGLLVLQETNAYYAQKIAESYLPGVEFNVPADSLPEYPYKVGDLLFDYYHIGCDIRTRFIITMRAMDTIQSPAVFLNILKEFSGRCIEYERDRDLILSSISQVADECSHKNDEAINEWIKDYSNWINDGGHKIFTDSLVWYIAVMGAIEKMKDVYGVDTFESMISKGFGYLKHIYSCFPAPLIRRGSEVLGQRIIGNDKMSQMANNDFENALVVWFHRRIYDLLKSESKEDFEKNATCLIYNNGNCPYISKYKTDKSYDCKTAPWLVVKGEKQAMCPYAVAAHSLGLWQNDLDINF